MKRHLIAAITALFLAAACLIFPCGASGNENGLGIGFWYLFPWNFAETMGAASLAIDPNVLSFDAASKTAYGFTAAELDNFGDAKGSNLGRLPLAPWDLLPWNDWNAVTVEGDPRTPSYPGSFFVPSIPGNSHPAGYEPKYGFFLFDE